MIDLTNKLKEIGQNIIQELSLNIKNQKQLDGKSILPVSQSTLKARQKAGISKSTRLLFTEFFSNNAFKFLIIKNQLTLFISQSVHPGSSISLNDIVDYNDKNSSEVNQKILASNRPSIFPYSESDMLQIKSFKNGMIELELEAQKQIDDYLDKNINHNIQINIEI